MKALSDDARMHFSEALRIYDPERDHDARFRFGADTGAAAAAYLAQTNWYLGEINRAIELIEESVGRAVESAPRSNACSDLPHQRHVRHPAW